MKGFLVGDSAVGPAEGCVEGEAVGSVLGSELGTTLGAAVGEPVGHSLGWRSQLGLIEGVDVCGSKLGSTEGA